MSSTAKSLTTSQAAIVFGVSEMSIFNWRKGIATRDPLPVLENPPDGRPRFSIPAVRRYARQYGLTLAREPEQVLADWDKWVGQMKRKSGAEKKAPPRFRSKTEQ